MRIMLTLRNKSVTVSRVELLLKLKENLEIHKKDFIEAVTTYQSRLALELQEAWQIAFSECTSYNELRNIRISFNAPISHESDYVEMIEMLEMSVDDIITLDSESFRAYIKNEWSWSTAFLESIAFNKTYISSKTGL